MHVKYDDRQKFSELEDKHKVTQTRQLSRHRNKHTNVL